MLIGAINAGLFYETCTKDILHVAKCNTPVLLQIKKTEKFDV